tara:strand:- start:390 stop:692 length:303 start_codon:yes stop_codon:yes gene_type:complete
MQKKEKLEHIMGKKTSLVCRDILETKDVIEGQIISDLLNDDALKALSIDEKKHLSLQIKSSLIQQFNSLVDRVQKSLEIKQKNLMVMEAEKKLRRGFQST